MLLVFLSAAAEFSMASPKTTKKDLLKAEEQQQAVGASTASTLNMQQLNYVFTDTLVN